MEIINLPEKYREIWEKCLSKFKDARNDDEQHAVEVTEFILDYSKDKEIDLEILIPVAMMHDIGHSAILPEHFKYITGGEKVVNGKLAHMLAGAKIAKEILESINYDKSKAEEIVNMISVHDGDQIEGWVNEEVYNTENKKLFHDIDCLDRYNAQRIDKAKHMFNNDMEKILKLLEKSLDVFISPEFREIAEKRMENLKNE
jgi:hypothetical protein